MQFIWYILNSIFWTLSLYRCWLPSENFYCLTFCLCSTSLYSVFSMTRFGEISALWQHFINLCQMVEGLFIVWAYFGKIVMFLATFRCCSWPNIEKQNSHLVTLPVLMPTYQMFHSSCPSFLILLPTYHLSLSPMPLPFLSLLLSPDLFY